MNITCIWEYITSICITCMTLYNMHELKWSVTLLCGRYNQIYTCNCAPGVVIVHQTSTKPFSMLSSHACTHNFSNSAHTANTKAVFASPCQLELPPYLGWASASAFSSRFLSQPHTLAARKSSAFHNLLLLSCQAYNTVSHKPFDKSEGIRLFISINQPPTQSKADINWTGLSAPCQEGM